MTTFWCRTEVTDETATLHLVGDVDIAAVGRLDEAGRALLHDYGPRSRGGLHRHIVLRLHRFGAFLACRKDAVLHGKSLRLHAIPERLRKVVHLTGIDELLGLES